MRKTSLYVVAAVLLGILIVVAPLTVFPSSKIFREEVERGLPAPMEESYKEAQDYSEISRLESLENIGLLIGVASAFAFLVFFYAKFHLVK